MLRKALVVAAALLLLGIGLAGVRTAQVHAATGEWRLSPSATPTVIHVDGRDYRRSGQALNPEPQAVDPQAVGQTPGGALVYLPTHATNAGVPTVLYAFDDSKVWVYELVGGP